MDCIENGMDPTENTTSLLLFIGRCLAMASTSDPTILALSKPVTILSSH
jgi:hypothetical protein